MTCDCLLLDEVGQLSAQTLAQLDIILRSVRGSNMPFGGCLILGSFDHMQLGAIDGLPLLLSSHIMTDFILVRMKHSVRAHSDPNLQVCRITFVTLSLIYYLSLINFPFHYQKIQDITRTSSLILQKSKSLKKQFFELMKSHVNFIPNMNDSQLGPEVQRMYSRRAEATAAAENYVTSSINNLTLRKKRYRLCEAHDLQRPISSRRDLQITHDNQIKLSLDKKKREPKRLLFYEGAMFEATVNGDGYSQSQILLMLNIPSQEQIDVWSDIKLMAAPPNYIPKVMPDEIPSKDTLLKEGWTEVSIKVTPERSPVYCHGSEAHRKQYSLRHIGSSTINKQMGSTILGPVAIEVTKTCSPWEKEQVCRHDLLSDAPSIPFCRFNDLILK